jgi:cation transport regulator ChaC
MSIRDILTDDLRAELKRREQKKREVEKPVAIEKPDFSPVIALCQSYVDEIQNGYFDEDLKQYIFEAAITAVFGDNVWG